MKRKSRARKPKKAEWPLLTISVGLRDAAEKLDQAFADLSYLLSLGEAAPVGSDDPFMQIKFASPGGRNRGLKILQLIEAGTSYWLWQVIESHRKSVTNTWRTIVTTP